MKFDFSVCRIFVVYVFVSFVSGQVQTRLCDADVTREVLATTSCISNGMPTQACISNTMPFTCRQMPFPKVKTTYEEMGAWGMETQLDLHYCNPDTIRSAEKIREYVVKLCELIKMKRFGECVVVHFGEDEAVAGFSMTQLIETSLISGHFANLTNATYINIFSCKPYDPEAAAQFTQEFFGAEDYAIHVVMRK